MYRSEGITERNVHPSIPQGERVRGLIRASSSKTFLVYSLIPAARSPPAERMLQVTHADLLERHRRPATEPLRIFSWLPRHVQAKSMASPTRPRCRSDGRRALPAERAHKRFAGSWGIRNLRNRVGTTDGRVPDRPRRYRCFNTASAEDTSNLPGASTYTPLTTP